MGWASGSGILDSVAKAVMPHLRSEMRRIVASELIDIFEGEDCDTICECEQPDIQREFERRQSELEDDEE